MKRKLSRVIAGLVIAIPLAVTSCMMNESDDFHDPNEQLEKDLELIDNYLATNNITALKDPAGLIRYVLHVDSTSGSKATIDSCAVVNYRGILLGSGLEFDKGENFAFPVSGVIDGWKVGIPLLNEGDSATLYIPSGLAYGIYGFEPEIPRNANLIFNVGVEKVGEVYKSSDRSCN